MAQSSRRQVLFWTLTTLIGSSCASIGKTYNIYQTLGNQAKPTPRGTVTIAPPVDDDISGLVATFQPSDAAELDVVAFDRMVDNGEMYTLIVSDDSSSKEQVSASVSGCSVRRSNLREEITLSISPTGKLMSVSYRPLISPLAAKTCESLMPLAEKPEAIFGRNNEQGMPFKTTVAFESHKPMMEIPTVLPQSRPPPGLNWYRRDAKNGPAMQKLLGEGGPGEEEQTGFKASFMYKIFSKYWYIILPLAVMSAFGAEEPEGVAQGSGGGQAATAAAGAAAAATTQRRGKRD
eukprot:scaffold21250_cov70-Cyclotella_meneghiniana.AAC.11